MNMKLIITVALLSTVPLVSSASSVIYADMNDSSNSLLMAHAEFGGEQNFSLSNFGKEADFIFHGVVTKVEYRLSDGTPQLPHTFVTFQVENLLKGQVNQQFITLRFIGGPDNEGNFLMVPGVPLFDVGDRDMLFVKGNGQSGCPLVKCEQGRFRIINNQVFTDQGRQLLQNNQGKLVAGSPVQLEEVRTNKIGETVVTTVSSNPSDEKDIGSSASSVVESQNAPVSLPSVNPTQLIQIIQQQLQQLATLGQLQTRPFVASVDIREQFSVGSASPVAPPSQTQVPRSVTAPVSDADRRELEMLRQNHGNPVFTNSKP
jgi:hypothetical protein